MRIGFISDLHVDINQGHPVMDLLAREACDRKLDVLAVAGDISETPERTLREATAIGERLEEAGCRFYYVPGNHDLWKKHCPQRATDAIYHDYCADSRCLSGKHVVLNAGDGRRIFLMGDTGWYDYSFASSAYTASQLDAMTLDGRTWQDRLYNDWTDDNAGRTDWFHERLLSQAGKCREQMREGDRLLVITHMLPRKEFCVPEERKGWGFFNGFLGSRRLGSLIRQTGADIAVCGHVHYRSSLTAEGIRWICPCLGTCDEWPLFGIGDGSCADHIRSALTVADL